MSKNTYYCSFCTKTNHEVEQLIAGEKTFICNECVDLCNDIIRKQRKKAAPVPRFGRGWGVALFIGAIHVWKITADAVGRRGHTK